MKPLNPQSRSLIDDVTAAEAPPPDMELEVWRTIESRLHESLPPTAADASRALTTKTGLFAASSPLLKLLIGVLAVGTVAAGAYQYRAAPGPRPQAAMRPSSSVPATLPSPQLEAAGTQVVSSLAEETRLIALAQRALRSGDPARAQSWIDQHAARFPRGELAQERDAARVLTLCALKRRPEARNAQQEFLRAWPNSPLADRVKSACPAQ